MTTEKKYSGQFVDFYCGYRLAPGLPGPLSPADTGPIPGIRADAAPICPACTRGDRAGVHRDAVPCNMPRSSSSDCPTPRALGLALQTMLGAEGASDPCQSMTWDADGLGLIDLTNSIRVAANRGEVALATAALEIVLGELQAQTTLSTPTGSSVLSSTTTPPTTATTTPLGGNRAPTVATPRESPPRMLCSEIDYTSCSSLVHLSPHGSAWDIANGRLVTARSAD